jgi:hypothetical protein
MSALIYSEYSYWSPVLGCNAARVSMCDGRGSEYYRIVPRLSGKQYRELKAATLELLAAAIERGAEPGELIDEEA